MTTCGAPGKRPKSEVHEQDLHTTAEKEGQNLMGLLRIGHGELSHAMTSCRVQFERNAVRMIWRSVGVVPVQRQRHLGLGMTQRPFQRLHSRRSSFSLAL